MQIYLRIKKSYDKEQTEREEVIEHKKYENFWDRLMVADVVRDSILYDQVTLTIVNIRIVICFSSFMIY